MAGEFIGTVGFALGAGAATFFAPCSYGLLPGYVGYYVAATDGDRAPLSGALARGAAAGAGTLLTFAILGGVGMAASDLLEQVLYPLEIGVAIALIGIGAAILAGVDASLHVPLPARRRSVLGFGLFGALYALAATACVLPLFLALVLQSLTLAPLQTVAVVGTYGGTLAVFMLALTVATAVGRDLGADRLAVNSAKAMPLAGIVLVLAGIVQLGVAVGLVG